MAQDKVKWLAFVNMALNKNGELIANHSAFQRIMCTMKLVNAGSQVITATDVCTQGTGIGFAAGK